MNISQKRKRGRKSETLKKTLSEDKKEKRNDERIAKEGKKKRVKGSTNLTSCFRRHNI